MFLLYISSLFCLSGTAIAGSSCHAYDVMTGFGAKEVEQVEEVEEVEEVALVARVALLARVGSCVFAFALSVPVLNQV